MLLSTDGILVNEATKNGATLLWIACSNGHLDVVRMLLSTDGILVNEAMKDGQTPLSTACQNGHVDVVRLLLAVPGIDVEKGAPGWPPLKLAQHFKLTAIASLLREHAATSNI